MPKSPIRYFKATDGKRTVFRASPTRVYQSATMEGSFSAARIVTGYYPTVEITKAEYDALVVLKMARLEARWAEIERGGGMAARGHIPPGASWVSNEAIPVQEAA